MLLFNGPQEVSRDKTVFSNFNGTSGSLKRQCSKHYFKLDFLGCLG